jgi:hypothetical protein
MNYQEKVLKHYGVEVKTDYDFPETHQWTFNTCSTADGYEVYVAKHCSEDINIEENVYYYNDDIVDKFSEILKDASGEIIYVDPECLDLEDIDWESWYEDIEDEL